MKKRFLIPAIALFCISLTSCDNKKKDKKAEKEVVAEKNPATAASIAQKWCELNAIAHKLEGSAKEAAQKDVEEFEQKMEEKYKDNDAFLEQIEDEAEKCEEASEGR